MCSPDGGIVMPGPDDSLAGIVKVELSIPVDSVTGPAIPGGTVTGPTTTPVGIMTVPIAPSYIPGDDVMLEELLREAAELSATSKEGIPQQYQRVNEWFDR